MAHNYIYIDDTFGNLEKGTINALQKGNEIQINFTFPADSWEDQIEVFTSQLPQNDGVLIDLRLNDIANSNGLNAQFRGSSVAQELRTLVKEKVIASDFPIVLISANNKIEESLDKTSYDLFDYVINKNNIEQPNGITFKEFRRLLITLSEGYKVLNKKHGTAGSNPSNRGKYFRPAIFRSF
jgi:CheY-like chemotaxis protein